MRQDLPILQNYHFARVKILQENKKPRQISRR